MEDRLRKFARLVDVGTFTATARELHISQPALSMAVHKLERELHAELLVRQSRQLQLTEAGKLAYEAARELGAVSSNLYVRIATLSGARPTLTWGMIDSVAGIVCASSASIDVLEQQAHLSIVVNNSRHLRRSIERSELDIAFVTEQTDADRSHHVATEPLVLVCHAAQAVSTGSELRRHRLPRFISYDHASTTRHLIDDALQHLAISAEPIIFSTSPEIMLQLVRLQKGSALLPYWLVKELIGRQELVLLGQPQPIVVHRPIAYLSASNRSPAIPYTTLVQHVQILMEQYNAAAAALRIKT